MTSKFLEESYSSLPSWRCGHNLEQPMLEELQLEKSSHIHILPSKDWSHCGTGESTSGPCTRRASHCCCCFHHSPFSPPQPGNACGREPKCGQGNPKWLFLHSRSYFLSLHCRLECAMNRTLIGHLLTVYLRDKTTKKRISNHHCKGIHGEACACFYSLKLRSRNKAYKLRSCSFALVFNWELLRPINIYHFQKFN